MVERKTMNGLIVFSVLSILMIASQLLRKNNITFIYLAIFIVPSIYLGGGYKSGLYFYIIIFLFMLIIKRRVIIHFSKGIRQYVIVALIVIVVSLIAWYVNNGKNISSVFVSLFGSLKYIILALEIDCLLQDYDREEISHGFDVAFRIVFLINSLAIIGQSLAPSLAAPFFDSIFQSDSTTNQVYELTTSGLSRLTGIYYHPSVFAIFNLCAIAYFWGAMQRKKMNILYVVLGVVFGFLSATKTFILGFALLLLLVALFNVCHLNNKKGLLSILVVLLVLSVVYLNYDSLFSFIRSKNPNWAYYFSFLKNPLGAFSSRYGSKGSIALSYELIQEHPFIGVGPIALQGEFVGDSSPISLLHDSGIVGLGACVFFYISSLRTSLRSGNFVSFMILAMIFVSGFALPVWLFYSFPFPVLLYALSNLYIEDR